METKVHKIITHIPKIQCSYSVTSQRRFDVINHKISTKQTSPLYYARNNKNWLINDLTNRTQFVENNESQSHHPTKFNWFKIIQKWYSLAQIWTHCYEK